MSVNDTWELIVRGTSAGTMHIHTLHFREISLAAGGGQALIDDWEAQCLTTYRGLFQIGQHPVNLLRATKVCGTVPLPTATEEVFTFTAGQGTRPIGSSQVSPSFLAITVAEKGVSAGRSRSGRFFLGGSFESDIDTNDHTAAYVALVQGYCNLLTTRYITPSASSFQLVTHSRLLAATGVSCEVSSTPVQQLVVNPRVTTMRSRKVGHGL